MSNGVESGWEPGCIVNSMQILFVIHTSHYLHIGSTQLLKEPIL